MSLSDLRSSRKTLISSTVGLSEDWAKFSYQNRQIGCQSVSSHYGTISDRSGDITTKYNACICDLTSRLFTTLSKGSEQSRGQVTDTGIVWRWNVIKLIKYRPIVTGNTLGFHQKVLTVKFRSIFSNPRC